MNSKLRAVYHMRTYALLHTAPEPVFYFFLLFFFFFCFPSTTLAFSQLWPGRLILTAVWRGNENCQDRMCLKRRTLFTAHKHWLPATSEALPLHAPFIKHAGRREAGEFVFSLSLCLQSATGSQRCSGKTNQMGLSLISLLIS